MTKFKQLENAFASFDYDLILSMLKCNYVSYDETNQHNQTLLHIALNKLDSSCNNYSKILNYLIEHTENFDIQDNNGKIPLHLAMYHYNSDIIEKIIKKTININLQDNNGNSALYNAIKLQKIDFINILFSHPNIKYNYKNKHGDSLLHIAIERLSMFYNCIPIIKHLLDKSYKINCKNSQGNTILHQIFNHISFSNIDTINFLLEYPKLNFNIINSNQELPLHLATRTIRDIPEYTYIFERIISKTDNINLQNLSGLSPLNLAFLTNKKHFSKALVKHPNIDYNLKNNLDECLLNYYVSYHNFTDDLFLKIIKNTDNIFTQDFWGNTIFHEAFNKRNIYLIRFLINYLKDNILLTKDINILNKKNYTILDLAIASPYDAIIIKPIIIDLIYLGAKNNQIDKVNTLFKPLLIYYSSALTFEELPEKIRLDKKKSEEIINERKQKIYLHPIIQRHISSNLIQYFELIKRKFSKKQNQSIKTVFRSSIVINHRLWVRQILRFSKEHIDSFFENPLNKDVIDNFPLKLL